MRIDLYTTLYRHCIYCTYSVVLYSSGPLHLPDFHLFSSRQKTLCNMRSFLQPVSLVLHTTEDCQDNHDLSLRCLKRSNLSIQWQKANTGITDRAALAIVHQWTSTTFLVWYQPSTFPLSDEGVCSGVGEMLIDPTQETGDTQEKHTRLKTGNISGKGLCRSKDRKIKSEVRRANRKGGRQRRVKVRHSERTKGVFDSLNRQNKQQKRKIKLSACFTL